MNGAWKEREREQKRGREKQREREWEVGENSTKRPQRSGSGSHINNNKVGHLIGFCSSFGTVLLPELYLTP